MREVSTGSGASSNTTRSSRAAQTAYVASHQGSARPFCRRGWPKTRSQLSANTGPSSSTTTAARATRRPTNRRNALRRTICFSSSRGSARVTTQSRSSRGSERTALSISSVAGRFQTLAPTTSGRASRRCARALFPTPPGPTSSTISGRAAPFRPVMIPLQLAPRVGLQPRRPAGPLRAWAQGGPAAQDQAPRLQVELVPVAGGAKVRQGGEVGGPGRGIHVGFHRQAQPPPDPEHGADDEREQQAGRAAKMGGQEAELVREPVSELARAGGLSRAVAAEQRDDRPAVREMLAALADDFEPAAQGENAVHDA